MLQFTMYIMCISSEFSIEQIAAHLSIHPDDDLLQDLEGRSAAQKLLTSVRLPRLASLGGNHG